MQDIKISVIIPVYNVEHVLVRCLEHVVHNTYRNLEIIIVDDGSIDRTADIYSKYAKQDKRIKIIKQKNSGPATARNTGLKAATGDYVHFCDSDDYVNLDYYERMADAAQITNADVVCGSVYEPGYIYPEFHDIKLYTDLEDKIAVTRLYDFPVIWRYIYRRQFLIDEKLLFPIGMFVAEDEIFAHYTIYHAKTLATACDAVYNCVVDNPKSLSKNMKTILKTKKNGSAKDYDKYIKFLASTGMDKIKKDLQDNGQIIKTTKVCTFRRCFAYSVKYMDGSKKLVIFGIPVFYRKVTQRKIKYYLFGMHLWYVK